MQPKSPNQIGVNFSIAWSPICRVGHDTEIRFGMKLGATFPRARQFVLTRNCFQFVSHSTEATEVLRLLGSGSQQHLRLAHAVF